MKSETHDRVIVTQRVSMTRDRDHVIDVDNTDTSRSPRLTLVTWHENTRLGQNVNSFLFTYSDIYLTKAKVTDSKLLRSDQTDFEQRETFHFLKF